MTGAQVLRTVLASSWDDVTRVTSALDDLALFYRVTRVRLEDVDPFASGLGWLIAVTS